MAPDRALPGARARRLAGRRPPASPPDRCSAASSCPGRRQAESPASPSSRHPADHPLGRSPPLSRPPPPPRRVPRAGFCGHSPKRGTLTTTGMERCEHPARLKRLGWNESLTCSAGISNSGVCSAATTQRRAAIRGYGGKSAKGRRGKIPRISPLGNSDGNFGRSEAGRAPPPCVPMSSGGEKAALPGPTKPD